MSTAQDDVLFGKIALNMHFISKERLEQALHYQKTRAPNVPLGEILLQYRQMTPEQIERVLEFQRRVNAQLGRSPQPGPGAPPGPNGAGQHDAWGQYSPPPGAPLPPGSSPAIPALSGQGAMSAGVSPSFASYRGPGAVGPMTPIPPSTGQSATAETVEMPGDGLLNTTIGGCQIVAKIGEGGMGAIYRARHEALRKDVVVKILPPEQAANPRTVERFFREARAAAKLEHPNIVQVLNVGTTDRGLHFIVMQYIDGQNLEDVITQKGRHPWKEALRIVGEVARGLSAAHTAGVIHRDIKADNILITVQGVVKLADFGLAKDLNSDLKLTADGAMIGTPLYMAPEIGRVKEIDARVDVYSLGVTFYYLLTGVQPFREFSAIEILSAKAHDKLKPPEQFVMDIPEPVRNVLGKMLEKDRDKRYLSMEEVIRDLEALDRGFPVTASEPALWGPMGSQVAPTNQSGKNPAKSTKPKIGAASSKRVKAASGLTRQPSAARTAAAPTTGGYPPFLIIAIVFAGVLAVGLGIVFIIIAVRGG